MALTGGAYITGRYTDVSNKYEQIITYSTNQISVNKVVGDIWTNIGAGVNISAPTVAGTGIPCTVQYYGPLTQPLPIY